MKKSAKVTKQNKATTRKPTVPKNVQAIITEGFSGHEELYDAICQVWGRTIDRVCRVPEVDDSCDRRMNKAIHEKMRNALYKGVLKANDRLTEKKLAKFIEPRKAK